MSTLRLYRGANAAMHRANEGRVRSNKSGPFEHVLTFDGKWLLDGSATLGPSAQNAVLFHQQPRAGHQTSGISTTPHLTQARYYATHEWDGAAWRRVRGVVYVIDRMRLAGLGVREHVVADTVQPTSIAVPEDDEVILVAPGDGELPALAIVEVLEISID